MTEHYEEEQEQEQDQIATTEDDAIDTELEQEITDTAWTLDLKEDMGSDARRRLEDLLDERRLREELDDYF